MYIHTYIHIYIYIIIIGDNFFLKKPKIESQKLIIGEGNAKLINM